MAELVEKYHSAVERMSSSRGKCVCKSVGRGAADTERLENVTPHSQKFNQELPVCHIRAAGRRSTSLAL